MQEIYEKIAAVIGYEAVRKQEPMKQHTTFRIGGPADVFAVPKTQEEICRTIQVCRQCGITPYIIGNGSNLLVGDRGIRGVVIQIYRNYNDITVQQTTIQAKAGALLSAAAKTALANGLTGMEFAAGIPGTLGGAAVMNAGAYGGEMKDILRRVRVLTAEGNVEDWPVKELALGYRTSSIAEKKAIVLEAEIELQEGKTEQIKERMEELKQQRVSKQPLDLPSAGSTFKRPEGYFAGKLIMDAGLRGFTVGGAQVSEKHCGFVVNRGNATAADVTELMKQVQKKVWEQFGVKIEPEIKMVGEF